MPRRQDLAFVLLAFAHGAAIVAAPVGPLIAAGVWWNSNTIAHNFVHRPFFRARWLNAAFELYQSLLLAVPQTLWRERHLAHHAGQPWRLRWSAALGIEVTMVVALWTTIAASNPTWFATAYLPGYLLGLLLCAMQGHYEHAGAVTTSHYGRLYNFLCFNDGYHCEHHAFPGVHWSELPARTPAVRRMSRWPALLRWLDTFSLDGLERVVLRAPSLQRAVVDVHARAFGRLLPFLAGVRRVAVVGGALFPRTVLILGRLLPDAALVVIDADAEHIATAREFLRRRSEGVAAAVEFRCDTFDVSHPLREFDLVVVPLALVGSRDALYARPVAPLVLVHDWWWRRVGSTGTSVSFFLLKRLNLVRR